MSVLQYVTHRTSALPPLAAGARRAVSPRPGRSPLSRNDAVRILPSDSEELDLLNKIFLKTAFHGSHETLISDAMKGAYDHTANTGGSYRSTVDLWSAISEYNDSSATPPIQDDYLRPMLGMTTAGYFPVAVLGLMKVHEKILLAHRVGDADGETLAQLEMGSRITTAIGGALFTGARPLSMAASAAHVAANSFTAPTALGRATYALGTIGGWFFGLTSFISGVRSSVAIHHVRTFNKQYAACKTNEEKIAFLQNAVQANPGSVYQMLREKYEKEFKGCESSEKEAKIASAIKDELVEAALQKGAEELHLMLKELSKEPGSSVQVLTEKECRKLLGQMKDRQLGSLPQTEAQILLRNALASQGLAVMTAQLQMKKDMEISRILTPECIQMIKDRKDPKDVLEKVDKAIYSSYKTHLLNLSVALLGVFCALAAIFITGGWGLVLIAIATLVYNIAGFAIDARGFIKDLKSGTPGTHDKIFLVLNMIGAAAAFAIGITLMCFFGEFAWLPFLFGLLIFLTWEAAHTYAWHRLNVNKKERMEKNPSLQFFVDNLKQEISRDKVRELFFRLSHEQRDAIETSLIAKHPENEEFTLEEIRDAAETHLHSVEEMEEEKKKMLMRALQPVVGRYLAQHPSRA